LGWTKKEIDQAFRDIDADKDRRLSSAEFVNFKKSLEGIDRKVHGVGATV